MDTNKQENNDLSRRHFLKLTGITTLGLPLAGIPGLIEKKLSIVTNPADAVANMPAARWAVKELETALNSRGIRVQICERLSEAETGNYCIVAASANAETGRQLLQEAGVVIPPVPEAQALVPMKSGGRQVLLAAGSDVRGLIYALLELADRVQFSNQALKSLDIKKPVIEQPANEVRSLNRLFVSDIEDKPWFNDREMWPKYLTMLATQRYNRFNLSFGIGYDFLRNVTDAYFLFAYPFLLPVKGYDVRVPELPDAERDNNLQMLKYISEETISRGLEFRLGLWMHGYEWINSPNPNYTIQGLTKENHGAYCRDAVRSLLQACPAISGITFRVHGESGVNEGSYEFWKLVFEGVKTCGRTVEIDMHSKGMDQVMIDAAVATGLPIVISPKYWAEHMGMPYHQADIRDLEVPKPEKKTSVLMNLSEGSRSFTRYGYGDLLKEDRPYKIVHRIWPGTQRLLTWGDPVTAAAHSTAFQFCGSAGVELMEPLSFKGRRGSGIAGDRCSYSDTSLKPRWDWEKYEYTLRVFGRLLYNPQSDADVWRRYLNFNFSSASNALESAMANATRILPIVLTTHGASAGNNTYWPEIYTNQPITEDDRKHPYSDSPAPKVFGNVSPLDPQLFLRINDYVGELLSGETSGKYTPIETAQWLEDYATAAANQLSKAENVSGQANKAAFRRIINDIHILVGLGRFFGAKFRSAVLYGIFEKSNSTNALDEAIKYYRDARGHWAKLSDRASKIYKSDITVGERAHLRGHWLDRLPAMDEDIARMTNKLSPIKKPEQSIDPGVQKAIDKTLSRQKRVLPRCNHTQPVPFTKGKPLDILLSLEKIPVSARLFYRHVNQGERYQVVEFQIDNHHLKATIPADYTNSAYPIQYYFELKETAQSVVLYPGFNNELTNQPYFVLRQVQKNV